MKLSKTWPGLVVAALCRVITATPATAASTAVTSSKPVPATSVTYSTAMTYGGIDDAQAKKVGNIVRYEGDSKILIDGKTGQEILRVNRDPNLARANAVAASTAANSGMAHTNGSVVIAGNCGKSGLTLNLGSVAANTYNYGTFFTTNVPSYDFQWEVDFTLNGRYYTRFFDRGPINPRNTWTSGLRGGTAPGNGRVVANVVPGVSHAYTITGGVCYSGGPLETLTV